MPTGVDCGTFNLVCCQRDAAKNFTYKTQVNAFIEFPLDDRLVFNMMHAAKIPLIERENVAYALGEAAVNFCYTLPSIELKRPMKDGCVNPKEIDAFEILNIMIHSMLDDVQDGEVLYYTVPANAVNLETDAEYHGRVLESIFKAFNEDGKTVDPRPINEGLALVYAELANKAYTGIGISCGAGMVNVCFAVYGAPVFQFAIVNSGDWIDRMAAKACGESPTFINKQKTKIDLNKMPITLVDRAIHTQYCIMIENTVKGIKEGIEKSGAKARLDQPIDFIVAGGTSSPPGFEKLFKEALDKAKLPINVGSIIKPSDPLLSVARGCLIAAENATK